jgi:hypothetical protein
VFTFFVHFRALRVFPVLTSHQLCFFLRLVATRRRSFFSTALHFFFSSLD